MPSAWLNRRREWDDMAFLDPYWAVLTDPDAKRRGWDRSAFFASGDEKVNELLRVAEQFHLPEQRLSALDFGCGLGRLTRALSDRFARVCGVDISGSLVEQARQLNWDRENCEFLQLHESGLDIFESKTMDLVCSFLVLQHQARESAIIAYVGEFVRILRPGGLAVFQIPTHIPLRNRVQPRRRAYAVLRSLGVRPSILYNQLGLDPMRMRYASRAKVVDSIELAGGQVLTVAEDDLAGGFPSSTYYVARSNRTASQARERT
jgi:SAM-dependent methyltransferase